MRGIREAWQAFLSSPLCFTVAEVDPCNFPQYLIQDAYYLKSETITYLADKTSNQEMKRLLKQNAQSLVEGELFIRQQFSKN